jgi:Yip1 domain
MRAAARQGVDVEGCMTTTTRNISAGIGTFIYRVIGAALLDGSVYEDVEADRRAAPQATAVVLLASLAPVVGLSGVFGFQSDALLRVAALSIVTWVAWAVLMFQIGTRVFPEPQTRTSLGELLRTTGFAAAPGLLQVFAVLPGMMMPVFVGTWIWMIAAMVVGVRHALDYRSTPRALLVCLTAAGLAGAMAMIFGTFFGPTVR